MLKYSMHDRIFRPFLLDKITCLIHIVIHILILAVFPFCVAVVLFRFYFFIWILYKFLWIIFYSNLSIIRIFIRIYEEFEHVFILVLSLNFEPVTLIPEYFWKASILSEIGSRDCEVFTDVKKVKKQECKQNTIGPIRDG